MKKTLTAFLLIFSVNIHAEDAMKARWEQRRDYLQDINGRITAGAESPVKVLVTEEIIKTGEFIKLIEKYNSGDNTLRSGNRKFPVHEIEKQVKETSLPVIKAYYVKSLAGDYLSKTATDRIAEQIKLHGKSLTSIDDSVLSGNTLRAAAGEYILETGKKRYDPSMNKKIHSVISAVELKLSKTDYVTNMQDLRSLIIDETVRVMEESSIGEDPLDINILHSTSTWESLCGNGVQQNELITSVKLFASDRKINLPENVDKLKPDEIEKYIFMYRYRQIEPLLVSTPDFSGKGGYNSLSYQIPDLSSLKVLAVEINRYRSQIVRNLNGSEGRLFSSRVENSLNQLTGRFLKSMEKKFESEKKRMERLTSGKKILIYNEEMFKSAWNIFNELKVKITEYSNDSAAFIDSLCLIGKKDPGEYIFTYKKHMDRKAETMAFLGSLIEGSSGCSQSANESVHVAYTRGVQYTVKISRSLQMPVSIPAEVRRGMTVESLQKVKSVNASFRERMKNEILSIQKNFRDYSKNHEEKKKQSEKSDTRLMTRLGQEEMEILISFSKKCSSRYEKMNYSDEAFRQYRDRFTELATALQGNSSDNAALSAVKSGTIISSCPGFDSKTLDAQYSEKVMLREMGLKSLNGAIELYRYYSGKGIKLNVMPPVEEIASVKKKLTAASSVKIVSWDMNEKNYRETDEKAVEYLKQLINKKAWLIKKNETGQTFTFTHPESGVNITVSLPVGWINNNSFRTLPMGGFKRIYISPDRSGEIHIVSLKEDGKNLKEFQEKMNSLMGYKLVQKKWGSVSGRSYLWTISRSDRDKIVQSYMVQCKGYIIVISGISDSGKQNAIHSHLDSIFGSIRV